MECDAENENQFAGCLSLDVSKFSEEWFKICELRKSEETCDDAGTAVPSHTYLAIRKRDDKVVGVIDLRHHINHPILGTWGGHCGYSVRASERGKGYAKEMLRLNIQNAKSMGIEKLLITCDIENAASEKVILASDGGRKSVFSTDSILALNEKQNDLKGQKYKIEILLEHKKCGAWRLLCSTFYSSE